MDQLNPEDILGLSPTNGFRLDQKNKRLLYEFEQLEPDDSHNILLRYGYGDKNFNIDSVLNRYATYYQTIDQKQQTPLDLKDLQAFNADDFSVHDWKGSMGFTLAMFIMIFGFPVLITLIGVSILITYIRNRRKKQNT